MTNDYIEHHGILGMKWGVRRYQNKDGSYTSAGRKRRGLSRKDISSYSDDKLRQMANRKILENRLLEENSRNRSRILEKAINTGIKGVGVYSNSNKYSGNNTKAAKAGIVKKIFETSEKGIRKELNKASKKKAVKQYDIKNLSDDDLKKIVERISLENKVADLYNVSGGRRSVENTLDTAGDILATTGSILGIMIAIKALKKSG